jgi:hypothetical protein
MQRIFWFLQLPYRTHRPSKESAPHGIRDLLCVRICRSVQRDRNWCVLWFSITWLLNVNVNQKAATRDYPPINLSPIFPTPLSGVPSSDFSCWTSHASWSLHTSLVRNAAESDKIKVTISPLVTTKTGDYVIYRPPPDTTLCDGIPRVTGSQTPTGSAPKTVITVQTTSVSTLVL